MGRRHGARREVESVDSYSYEGGGMMKDLLGKWSLAVFSSSGRYLSLFQRCRRSVQKRAGRVRRRRLDTLKSLQVGMNAADSETSYTSLFRSKIH